MMIEMNLQYFDCKRTIRDWTVVWWLLFWICDPSSCKRMEIFYHKRKNIAYILASAFTQDKWTLCIHGVLRKSNCQRLVAELKSWKMSLVCLYKILSAFQFLKVPSEPMTNINREMVIIYQLFSTCE